MIGQTIQFNCNKKSMTSYSLNTVQITALKSERKILKKNGVNTCNVWFEKISISPPPPTHGRDRIFQEEGGVNLPNFPVGSGGVTIGKYFQRVLVTRERVTKKKHKNLPQQFICEDIKHDES